MFFFQAVSPAELKAFEEPVIHSLHYEGDYQSSAPTLLPFELVYPAATIGELTAEVVMPSKKIDYPSINDNSDGSITIKYLPREAGLHEMQIKHNGEHVQGEYFCIIGGGGVWFLRISI